jgi:arginyl-tRNA synthetase
MILDFQTRLGQTVRAAAQRAFGADVALPGLSFQYPPRLELGDLALTAAFDLAKTLRCKPRDVAAKLAGELSQVPGIQRVEVAGAGYLNLFLDRSLFARELAQFLGSDTAAADRGPHVIVEHTSINPNKAAHIGHLRNAVLGDTFVRALRHRGYDVGVQNYIDDTGVQVADVVVGFLHLDHKTLAEVAAIPGKFDYYCWDLYARVGEFYAADPSRKALQAETLHAIEAGAGEVARLAAYVAGRIVDCHLKTMARLGIDYDLLAHESDILRLRFWESAFERLRAKGAIRLEGEGKSVGCWVLAMEGEANDEDKIIVRSNGTVTYTGKDIAYQLWKLGLLGRDFHYRQHTTHASGRALWSTTSGDGESGAPTFGHAARVYNVIDVGQSYPQRVVKAALIALGHEREAAGSHHLAYEKVVLSVATARALGYEVADDATVVKVSGRKGLGVKADDLIDALVGKARAEIEARDPEREAEARERSAREIAMGALRYFLLRFGRTKIITFDMDEALAFVGETGPYVQNAVVRAGSIFNKLASAGHDVPALLAQAREMELAPLLSGNEGDEAWALLMLIARSEEVIEQAVEGEEVAMIARHAFAVAQAFHGYYQKPEYSLLHAESEERRAFRVLLVDLFIRQMKMLLDLLGIPIPERM